MLTVFRKWFLLTAISAVALGCLELPAHGQESEKSEEGEAIHIVGLFLGATTKFQEQEEATSFTLAGEYEYRGADWRKWSVGGVAELIFEDEIEGIVMPLVYYHFTEVFFARTGGGLEIGRGEDESERETHFIFRVGVGYEFPVGGFSIVPSVDFDAIRSDPAAVYGVVLAKEL